MLTAQKQKAKAGLLRAMESTDYLADAQISRMLYPEGHPNYQPALESLIASLESITVEDLKTFHSEHYGPESMRLVFAGDIRFDQLTAAVENAFSAGAAVRPIRKTRLLPTQPAKKQKRSHLLKNPVFPYDRPSPPTRRTDPDYLAFMVGTIWGGSFHSRLMETVRQKQGRPTTFAPIQR